MFFLAVCILVGCFLFCKPGGNEKSDDQFRDAIVFDQVDTVRYLMKHYKGYGPGHLLVYNRRRMSAYELAKLKNAKQTQSYFELDAV